MDENLILANEWGMNEKIDEKFVVRISRLLFCYNMDENHFD